jgi:ubiquinone/menaquinone biosynthesis C-methylase UbiE
MLENKFERRFPTHQNAIDIFSDRWASNIEEVYPGLTSGQMPMFSADPRPSIAAQHLGLTPGSLQGINILELGPLEGAHTYQLAKLGADSILAIEANAEAFLKCLVVKEILQTPRCRFLLGDCLKFLQDSRDQFDLIFCSGILYHMENPFELIEAISVHTDRVFLWTTHYNPDGSAALARLPKPVVCDGLKLTFYEQTYSNPEFELGTFCGGNKPSASWLSREDIELCFRHFGYDLTVHADEPGIYGPCITATGIREARALRRAHRDRLSTDNRSRVDDKSSCLQGNRMNNQVNSSAQTSPHVESAAPPQNVKPAPWQNVTHVKLNRSNYKSIWNAVSISEDDAKFAVIGSLDEEAYKSTGEVTKNRLQQFVGISPDDVVLEIGAGVGRVGAALAPICKEWIGADVSENMISHIKQRLGEFKNVRTVTTNGFDLSEIPSESIDVVYCTVVFMHLDEWERFGYIKEGFRVLKPGGRMLVDNVDLTSDEGWIFFEGVCAILPQERPAQISKTSTPQELETYFRRAGYDNIAQSHADLWVMTYGKKPFGT